MIEDVGKGVKEERVFGKDFNELKGSEPAGGALSTIEESIDFVRIIHELRKIEKSCLGSLRATTLTIKIMTDCDGDAT